MPLLCRDRRLVLRIAPSRMARRPSCLDRFLPLPAFADERHLWPHFHWLIQNSRPAVVFGEQVASKDGLGWLDLVQADLEGSGYASGAVDTCAAGFGAPHIRQRMYWVAYAHSGGSLGGVELRKSDYGFNGGAIDGMVNGVGEGLEGHRRGLEAEGRREGEVRPVAEAGEPCGVADASNGSRQRCEPRTIERGLSESVEENAALRTGPANGHWSDADWLHCRDGKWRPVEPGTFPLAHGAAARVGRLRGYGNAINAEQAQAFIEAYVECFRLSQSYELTTDKGVFG